MFNRSHRRKPRDVAEQYSKNGKDPDGFESKFINEFIGRGVFSTEAFSKGDFLLEYKGHLHEGHIELESNFVYYFTFKGGKHCIDATKEPSGDEPSLGRLVNHADNTKQKNCSIKIIDVDDIPHLCLFSTRDICIGEELRYDYGIKVPWKNTKENKLVQDKEQRNMVQDKEGTEMKKYNEHMMELDNEQRELEKDNNQREIENNRKRRRTEKNNEQREMEKDDEQGDMLQDNKQRDKEKDNEQRATEKDNDQRDIENVHKRRRMEKNNKQREMEKDDEQGDIEKDNVQREIEKNNAQSEFENVHKRRKAEKDNEQRKMEKDDEQGDTLQDNKQREIEKDNKQRAIENDNGQSDTGKIHEMRGMEKNNEEREVEKDDEQGYIEQDNEQTGTEKDNDQREKGKDIKQRDTGNVKKNRRMGKNNELREMEKDDEQNDEQRDMEQDNEQREIEKDNNQREKGKDIKQRDTGNVKTIRRMEKNHELREMEKDDEQGNMEQGNEQRGIQKDNDQREIEKENDESEFENVYKRRRMEKKNEQREMKKDNEQREIEKDKKERAIEKDNDQRETGKVHEMRGMEKNNEQREVEKDNKDIPMEKDNEQREVENDNEQRVMDNNHKKREENIDNKQKEFKKKTKQSEIGKDKSQREVKTDNKHKEVEIDNKQREINFFYRKRGMDKGNDQRVMEKDNEQKNILGDNVEQSNLEKSEDIDLEDDIDDPEFVLSNDEYVSDSEDYSSSDDSDIIPVAIKKPKLHQSQQGHSKWEGDKTYPENTQIKDISESPAKKGTKIAENKRFQKQRKESKDIKEDETLIEDTIVIPTTTAYKDGKRVVDKEHACYYCGKLFPRVSRHLRDVHKNEEEIKNLKSKTEKEQKKVLDGLRLNADYKYNLKVLTENKGQLILPRRPSDVDAGKYSHSDYLPCIYCKGFYLKYELWRHRDACQFRPEDNTAVETTKTQKKGSVQSSSVLLLESSLEMETFNSKFLEGVIGTFLVDDAAAVAKRDKIILKVGENLFFKHGTKQRGYISQEMRLLARLTIELREICNKNTASLTEFLIPSNYDNIVAAAQSLAGKEEKKDSCIFKIPSVALKCGPLLKKCCIVLKGQALRNSDSEKERDAERLQKLFQEEWKNSVTSVALRSIKEAKRNEQVLLPSAEDLLKLKQYIENEMTKFTERLRKLPSLEDFKNLSEVLLCRLIMFNRRRSGEASKILLKDYETRPKWGENLNKEIVGSLKPLEQKLVNRLDMIEIRGKRGRTVPVILTPDMRQSMDILISCRMTVGIDTNNAYLFPRSSGENHIDGHICMRKLTKKAELEFPERICSTNMRKYIATVVQVLNLNEGETEWLSNHLGHSVNVHKEFYRNQEAALELGVVAKMLIAVDNGQTLQQQKETDIPDELVLPGPNSDSEADEKDDEELEIEHLDKATDNENTQKPKTFETKTKKQKHMQVRQPWSLEEIQAVKRTFQSHLNSLKVPGKKDCEAAKAAEPILENRHWKAIKFYVYNQIVKNRKYMK